jgi:hypothetical protein
LIADVFKLAMPLLKRLVAGLSLMWPGVNPGPDNVEFVVDKVVPGKALSTSQIILPKFHAHISIIHIHVMI